MNPLRAIRRAGRRRYRLGTMLAVLAATGAGAGLLGVDVSLGERLDLDLPTQAREPQAASGLVNRVIDGDTLELADGRTVRLYGVDAPETQKRPRGTPWCLNPEAGDAATAAVEAVALSQPVTFGHVEADSSGRDMAAQVILPDGTDLGAWLVANGHAVDRPDLTDAGRHLPDPPIDAACPPGVDGGQEPNQ